MKPKTRIFALCESRSAFPVGKMPGRNFSIWKSSESGSAQLVQLTTNSGSCSIRPCPRLLTEKKRERLHPAALKKYTFHSRFWHENRGIPRRKQGLESSLKLRILATWVFSSGEFPRPWATTRIEALLVGYLGFCAQFFLSTCIFSGKPVAHAGIRRLRAARFTL